MPCSYRITPKFFFIPHRQYCTLQTFDQFGETDSLVTMRTGALVQWLKLPAWKVGDRGFKPHSGLQVSKKQSVSSPLTRKDSILWGISVAERARPRTARARISNPVSGRQCHLIHLTILKRLSWPSLTFMCTKVA